MEDGEATSGVHWTDENGEPRHDPVLADWWFTHYAYRVLGEHFPGVDADASRLVMRLRRATGTLSELARSGLADHRAPSTAGQRILLTLMLAGPLTQAQIADYSGMSRAAVSSAVRTLIVDGMISRTPSPKDGRAVLHAVTPHGEEVYREAFLARNAKESELLHALTAKEYAQLMQILEKLMSYAASHAPDARLLEAEEPADDAR